MQRYKVQQPIKLRTDQISRIRNPNPEIEKKVVVKTKKQIYIEDKEKTKKEALAKVPEELHEKMMMFTDSEDDSVESDEEMPENEKRLVQVFWRTRNWFILQNQGLLKLLISQKGPCSVIFTPISPDNDIAVSDRSIRWVSLETKLFAIFKNL